MVLVGGLATAALAASSASRNPFGDEQVGQTYANGILLPTQQWIKPLGSRVLLNGSGGWLAGRLLSSAISPNGDYLAALSWNDFTGFLTVFDLKTGKVIQQVGTGIGSDKFLGDGTVAADGPLWSADGKTLWVPQTSDLAKFSVAADGKVAASPVLIPLETTTVNLTTGNTTAPDLPSGMALSQDGSKLYVALNGVNQLGVINTTTNQLVHVTKVGNAPRQVVLVGNDAFVSNEGGRRARPGEYTNNSDGTNIVASKVTGAATTGTVSEVSLTTGKQVKEIKVGLEPTAEYQAPDGILMVANSNDDSVSMINPVTAQVVQTFNVNPLPGSTVGSYPNAITMPSPHTILVSIGRDNALAVYGYNGPRTPVKYEGLIPTDFYPVGAQLDPAIGKIVVTNDKGIGARGPESTIDKGPGTSDATGHNTYDDTGSLTEFAMPSEAALSGTTARVFTDNNWDHVLASKPLSGCKAAPVAIPTRLGCPSKIKHVFLIVRENRTYDQELGDIGKGNSDPKLAQFGAKVTPNARKLSDTYGLFDNFYDEGTLSADGHNWLMQADANDYIEKEFGAFYRSYPAQGGDALAYQRDGFLWNAAEAAGADRQVLRRVQQLPHRACSDPVLVAVLPGLPDHGGQGQGPAAGGAVLGAHLRGHPLAQRHRRSRLPGVQPRRSPTSTGRTSGSSRSRRASRPGSCPTSTSCGSCRTTPLASARVTPTRWPRSPTTTWPSAGSLTPSRTPSSGRARWCSWSRTTPRTAWTTSTATAAR